MPSRSLIFKPKVKGGIPEITCQDLAENLGHLVNVRIIDVRNIDEFNGHLGHIHNAESFPLGDKLINLLQTIDPHSEIVFVCRSGARSAQAVYLSQRLGCHRSMNLVGGMIEWNALGLPAEDSSESLSAWQ